MKKNILLQRCQKLAFWFTVLTLTACAQIPKINSNSDDLNIREDIFPELTGDYKLQHGDRIGMLPFVDNSLLAEKDYLIGAGDVISVRIQDRPDISLEYRVNPSGNVQFLQINTLKVTGLTLNQLRDVLTKEYSKVGDVDAGSISVGFVVYNQSLDRFVEQISRNDDGGTAYSSLISIAGRINFPLIGFVTLAGLTLPEATAHVEKEYQKYFNNLKVTLLIEESTSHNISILGEVNQPTTLPISGNISVLSALSAAGGYTANAKLDSVMVVQRRNDDIYVNKYDLEKDLFVMATVNLVAGDFVFVPRSSIGSINKFVDQYLRRTLPFSTSATYRLNDSNN